MDENTTFTNEEVLRIKREQIKIRRDQIENDSRYDFDEMYDNPIMMIKDIKTYAAENGNNICCCDKIVLLRMGFICGNTNKTWGIGLSQIMEFLYSTKEDAENNKLIRLLLGTTEGKEKLLFNLNNNL